MSKNTSIQWAHTTVNPVMGCDGCELYPALGRIREAITNTITNLGVPTARATELVRLATPMKPQSIKLELRAVSNELASVAIAEGAQRTKDQIAEAIKDAVAPLFVCYAADLHRFFNPSGKNRGYAHPFEAPKEFPGRMQPVALLGEPKPNDNANKPWLVGFPRLVFISDMGDALSHSVSFEYLSREVVEVVGSFAGKRHVWLWVTKRPARMAEFSRWMANRGIAWPDNLVAMTTVTGPDTLGRVDQLREVNARYRGLSLEPLWADIKPQLDGIHWVIVGGQSGHHARPFHIEWLENLRSQCRSESVAFFAKQFGRRPFSHGQPITLTDPHGGEWEEWPEHLRVRELPDAWRLSNTISLLVR